MTSSKAKIAVLGENLPFDFGVNKLGRAGSRPTKTVLLESFHHDSSFSKQLLSPQAPSSEPSNYTIVGFYVN